MQGNARIGLMAIGLDTYWPQFANLRDRLLDNVGAVADLLVDAGIDVENVGMVDTVDLAFAAGDQLRRADVELVMVYAATYALSSTVLPAVRRLGVPVIILNLQPAPAIDYAAFNALGDRTAMTGEWLAYCGSCPVPEIANVLNRGGIAFHQVTGVLADDAHVHQALVEWAAAAHVVHAMRYNRLGLLGRYYNGMLDIYTDQTLQLTCFGGHMQVIEMDELAALREQVAATDIDQRVRDFQDRFDIQSGCEITELRRAAQTSLALDALVAKHRLGALAYYFESVPGHAHEDIIASVILGNSLLTANGVPVAGEYEIKNVQAMKILDLMGAGGSFTEFYAIDYAADIVLMGHDGPGHIAIAEGKTKVRPLEVYHGKPGSGLSVEMSVRHGPVTLLSVIEHNGGLALLCAEAESVPGPTLEIGNTNSRYKFSLGARGFVEAWNAAGPAHHCAIGVGHRASVLKKIAAMLGIDCIQIC